MQPLQLRFTYTESEYLSASRLLMSRETNLVARLGAFFFLILFGGIVLTVIEDFIFPLWSVVLIALLFEAAFVYKIFVDMPRRYFRGDPKLRDEYRLTFSNDGIWLQTSQIDSKLAWSLYTRVLENSSLYVIVYGTDARMMTTVPKRTFRNAQEELEFRNLLRLHVDPRLTPTNASIGDRVPEYVPTGSEPPDWR
ncbi:MAG TPA: YcxB family protein [Pyrinomonadaceae bacterium]